MEVDIFVCCGVVSGAQTVKNSQSLVGGAVAEDEAPQFTKLWWQLMNDSGERPLRGSERQMDDSNDPSARSLEQQLIHNNESVTQQVQLQGFF